MFFITPMLSILAVYILAAVLPAIILLRYIYKHDTVEKEPPGLLLTLLFMGVLAALCATVLEAIFQTVLDLLVDPGSPVYTILLAFLVVAIAAAMVLRSRILDARARAEALRSQAISLEQENADLQEKLDSVGSVEGIMQVAQEELDMVDPASVIFTPVN